MRRAHLVMIPRNDLRRYRESSPLSPARDSGSFSRMYLGMTRTVERTLAIANKTSQLAASAQASGLPGFSVPSSTVFYPFKTYQPTNISDFLFIRAGQLCPLVVSYGASSGALKTCKIVTTATNLAANPPEVNAGETWRFWAVRDGIVETRSNYTVETNYINNFAGAFIPTNTDGLMGGYDPPNEVAPSPPDVDTTETTRPPLVLGIDPPSAGQSLHAWLWLQITPDTSSAALPSVALMGYCTTTGTFPDGFVSTGNNQISVSVIEYSPATTVEGVPQPLILQATNFIFDHAVSRFPCGNGNFPASANNGTIKNFRGQIHGNWGLGGSIVIMPSDLGSQVFYPGDIIRVDGWGGTGGVGIPPYVGEYEFVGAIPGNISVNLLTYNYGTSASPLASDTNWKLLWWAIQASANYSPPTGA